MGSGLTSLVVTSLSRAIWMRSSKRGRATLFLELLHAPESWKVSTTDQGNPRDVDNGINSVTYVKNALMS